jgi:hypothetical protein
VREALPLKQDRFRWKHLASTATSRLKLESCSLFESRVRFTVLWKPKCFHQETISLYCRVR